MEFQLEIILWLTTILGKGGRAPKFIPFDITGNFIITWKAYNENSQQLLTQKFTSVGNPLGSNLKLSFE